MRKARIRTYLALVLLVTMTYPLLIKSAHVWFHHTEHVHDHHVDYISIQEQEYESSHCYICDLHLAPGIISRTNENTVNLTLSSPQKFALYTCSVKPFDGSSFALRAPPVTS